jgi:hypothetical protein
LVANPMAPFLHWLMNLAFPEKPYIVLERKVITH